jgi:hypothetical protein
MDIRTIAINMFVAIDRTSPKDYNTFDDYLQDYRMRWESAMQLLEYAVEMDESDSDSDSDESINDNF